tara:strand:- start:194 stop:343 length:150 start_codon:yes stop_codon:yes gene_type:complete
MTVLTIIILVTAIFKLGQYALRKGMMIEQNKELMKNMQEWEEKQKKNKS